MVTVTFSLIRDAEQNESSRLHIRLTASALINFFSSCGVGVSLLARRQCSVLRLIVSPAFLKPRRQKWETVEKYDQCLPVMGAWNPRRLSKLLARKSRPGNHGNGRSSHAEGGSEPACRGSYWFFDGHQRGFMRKITTWPLCCATGHSAWERRLHSDDVADTYDHTA